jgi:hypothetical protein
MDVLWVIGESNKQRNHEMRFLRLVEGVRIFKKSAEGTHEKINIFELS